jgi:hypothetical protein
MERAAAWNGDVGSVSPALVDRFSQRVADRVQRSTRAHQVDSFSGGDNLDGPLDMPLVTNEGSITPLSDGGSDETPFEFGSFSPENVQRKAAPADAPAAPPPMPNALRERAEQLRQSMATNTPAPPIAPSPGAPAIQPSRIPGINLPATPANVPAPRVTMQRAKPISRVEEIGTGSAPKPAAPDARMPEPPKTAVQRSAQTPSPQPASPSVPVPTVQRAIPPSVVQGQGRLTQMLQARFKPKLEQARNPDASDASDASFVSGEPGDSGAASAPDISSAPTPRISRSAQPPAPADFLGSTADLTPRAPLQRLVAPDAGDAAPSTMGAPLPAPRPAAPPAPATDVPTPKARALRKPATPAPAPGIQRKAESSAPAEPGQRGSGEPAEPAQPAPAAAQSVPPTPVQRVADDDAPVNATVAAQAAPLQAAPPQVQRQAADETPADAPSALSSAPVLIQRDVRDDAGSTDEMDMPVVAPAARADAPEAQAAPAVQRSPADLPQTPDTPTASEVSTPSAALPATPGSASAAGQPIQRKTEPAPAAPGPSVEASPAPADLILRAPAAPGDAPATIETGEAAANTSGNSQASTPARVQPASAGAMAAPAVQRSTLPSAPATPQGADTVPQPMPPIADATPSEVQRSPSADATASAPATPLAETPMPELILRAPAEAQWDEGVTSAQLEEGAAHDSVPAVTAPPALQGSTVPADAPAVQRMAVNAPAEPTPDAADLPPAGDAMPLVQRAPAENTADADGADDASNAGDMPGASPARKPAPAIQRATSAAAKPEGTPPPPTTASAPATPANDSTMGVIQRQEDGAPVLRADAADDLTLRAPAPREADAGTPAATDAPVAMAPVQPLSTAPQQVQRAARSEAGMSAAPDAPAPKARAQRNAPSAPSMQGSPATSPMEPSNAEMVLRSPALPRGDAATDAGADAGAVRPLAGRAGADTLKPAKMKAGLGMIDMPVLRAVTREAGEAVTPEARTLSMPIVQRAAVKHEREMAQEAQARPANPFVAQQERAERMPVVQRAPAAEAPDVQRAEDAEMAAKIGESSAPPSSSASQGVADRAITEAELLKTAQRLLPIIKRMLAVERERLFGR